MNKPTPGPWHADGQMVVAPDMPKRVFGDHNQFSKDFIVVQTDMYSSPNREQCLANAQLIASAPDLLTACDELIELLEMVGYDHDDWPHNPGLVARARQAILKARGLSE